MSEIANKNNKEITEALSSRRNSDFNRKCLIALFFFILSAISIFSFSYYNNKFLVNFKNYPDKNQEKKELVKRTYSFYVAEIIKIISLIIFILVIWVLVTRFYKDFFLKKKYEIVNKEENHSCFIEMLLAICLDEKGKNSLRSPALKGLNCTKHTRKIFFSYLLKKKATKYNDFCKMEYTFRSENEAVDKKIEEILTKERLASLFRALIEIQNGDINYFYLRDAYSFKELSDNKVYKQNRNQCLFRTLLQFFDIIAYYVFCGLKKSHDSNGTTIIFRDLDDIEKEIKKRADEDNFVLVDPKKYLFSGDSLEEDLKDLYNNIDTDIDID